MFGDKIVTYAFGFIAVIFITSFTKSFGAASGKCLGEVICKPTANFFSEILQRLFMLILRRKK
jgi:hypothetical protein